MDGTLKTYDNYDIYYQYHEVENAKATIVFSHGFVEYSAHYSRLAPMFNAHGYNVFKYDVRGHGRTTAPLGELKHFQDFADDLNVCVTWVQNRDSSLPVYTMGFSLGGMITAVYGIMYPYAIAGQILLGPGLLPQSQFREISESSISIHEFLELMGTSGDAGIKQLVAMDSPYVLKRASRTFIVESLVEAQEFIWEHTSMYKHPVLILHGENDPILPWQGSQKFFEAIGSSDKTLEVLPDKEHDLLRIREATAIVARIASWLDHEIEA